MIALVASSCLRAPETTSSMGHDRDSVLSDVETPTVGGFHAAATRAAVLGRPVLPALMLIARDGKQPLGRLCAITAIGRMGGEIPAADEALRRIRDLPAIQPHGHVVRAAWPDRAWPFKGSWDPLRRLEILDGPYWSPDMYTSNPEPVRRRQGGPASQESPSKPVKRNRFGEVIRDEHWNESPFPDGWWREQA